MPGKADGGRKAVLLRLDPRVHDALQRWAKDELRSFNAQVEFVLRRALQREGRLAKADEPREDEPREEPTSKT